MKKIIKRIFPVLFLKGLFLSFNKILLKTYYPLVFPRFKVKRAEYLILEEKNPFLELFKQEEFPAQGRIDFKLWMKPSWTQDQYLIKIDQPHRIEPYNGWALVKNKLIYPSLGFSGVPYLKRPSLFNVLYKKPDLVLESAVSFRDTGEENYFHFFNDVIAKFYFLESKSMLSEEQSLIVSKKLFERDYFQFFLKNTRLGNYKWIVQNETAIIESRSTLFCKPYTHSLDIYKKIVDDLKVPKNNLDLNKKVYLRRSKKSLRYVSNEKALLPLLESLNYEVVDSAALTFEQQVQLFSSTGNLIAVHGAGLTNMMFRMGGEMKITELFSPYLPYHQFHYIMMSKMFNFDYSYLTGKESKSRYKGGFDVPEQKLIQLLNK